MQVDFVLPERLDASYINEKGEKKRPVMLHRAILGSFERFIGILLENDSGKLPHWISPIQIAIINIDNESLEYSEKIKELISKENIRCIIDSRNEKVNYKIREHSKSKIPYILVVGKKEVDNRTVSLRMLGSAKVELLELEIFLKNIKSSCRMP